MKGTERAIGDANRAYDSSFGSAVAFQELFVLDGTAATGAAPLRA
jgi:hypothetical protein